MKISHPMCSYRECKKIALHEFIKPSPFGWTGNTFYSCGNKIHKKEMQDLSKVSEIYTMTINDKAGTFIYQICSVCIIEELADYFNLEKNDVNTTINILSIQHTAKCERCFEEIEYHG